MSNLRRAMVLLGVWLFVSPATQAQQADTDPYIVQPGDLLVISVWKEEDLQQEVLVRPDGGITFPLAGEIQARGKTVEQIREDVVQKLSRFIPDLVVTVTVKQILGNRIYVIGQVKNAGSFVMNPRVDVVQALSMAGGATTFAALNDIVILRRINGTQTAFPFRYNDVARGRNLDQNILLQSGDVVIVP